MDWTLSAAAFVLITAYLFYVARLFRIAFGHAWEKSYKTPPVGVSLRYVLPDDKDDCDDHLLWQTQLPALKFLRSAGLAGVPVARMAQFYRDFARAYPELTDGSDLCDWIVALQSAGVAVHCRAGAMIAITEKGLFILETLDERHMVSQRCGGTQVRDANTRNGRRVGIPRRSRLTGGAARNTDSCEIGLPYGWKSLVAPHGGQCRWQCAAIRCQADPRTGNGTLRRPVGARVKSRQLDRNRDQF